MYSYLKIFLGVIVFLFLAACSAEKEASAGHIEIPEPVFTVDVHMTCAISLPAHLHPDPFNLRPGGSEINKPQEIGWHFAEFEDGWVLARTHQGDAYLLDGVNVNDDGAVTFYAEPASYYCRLSGYSQEDSTQLYKKLQKLPRTPFPPRN
jgi:hypothetical protein